MAVAVKKNARILDIHAPWKGTLLAAGACGPCVRLDE
jgi:hypothetical protein